MKMNGHLEKILKRAMLTAVVVCGAFFAAAAHAGYVVYQWSNQSGESPPVRVSQADAAKTAAAFERIGECEAYEDACLAAFVAYYRPECLPYIKTMSDADKKARRDWITPARLKQHAAARDSHDTVFTYYPQPYNVKMVRGKSMPPFGFNITDGDPVFNRNKNGEITGMDVAKTKFVGRYVDILPVAVFNGLLYDVEGLLGDSEKTRKFYGNPLRSMIDMLFSANVDINDKTYKTNAKGEALFTSDAQATVAEYYWQRGRNRMGTKGAVEYMNYRFNEGYENGRFDETEIRQTIKKIVKEALASPVSRRPLHPARENVIAG